MERKIGEIFNYQDNWYQCIENTGYGCINLCKNNHGDTLAVGVFPNREEAVSNCPPSYLGTIKIEWEE